MSKALAHWHIPAMGLMIHALVALALALGASSARMVDFGGHQVLPSQVLDGGSGGQQHQAIIRRSGGVSYTREALEDQVTSLPGWGALHDFNMFAGYITVDEPSRRRLFYAYVESSVAPDTHPLLLWLNGGPGCSSLGGGFLSELGPFLPLPGGAKLQANPYAWNRVANVLFVESPAFVGFSSSDNPADSVVGDARTAADMRKFLLGFIQRYPHLTSRELYISGESYAGHYLPTLAWEIVQGNQQGSAAGHLNFKGIMVGNPWSDAATDNLGAVDYWWAHALISDRTALGIKANCDFARIGPLDAHPDNDTSTKAGACDHFCNTAAFELGPINIYHIYADVCVPPATRRLVAALQAALQHQQQQQQQQQQQLGSQSARAPAGGAGAGQLLGVQAAASQAATGALPASHIRSQLKVAGGGGSGDDPDAGGPAPPYDPCVDDEVETYLNRKDVQQALHVNASGELPVPWSDCTRQILYSREDLLSSMIPVWHKLITTEGLRFLVYSGDVDGIVPVVGTRRWVAGLGLVEAAAWRPWSCPAQGQVGGYTVEYHLPWAHQHQQQQGGAAQKKEETEDAATAAGAATEGDASSVVKGGSAAKGGFVFATVRGAGHMVPYVQPERALHLLSHFLQSASL